MKTLFLSILILTLVNCTSYSIEKGTDATGNLYTNVYVKSTRDLEQPVINYERKGVDAKFNFSAASVDNNTDAFIGMFTGMMGMMMDLMKKLPVEE